MRKNPLVGHYAKSFFIIIINHQYHIELLSQRDILPKAIPDQFYYFIYMQHLLSMLSRRRTAKTATTVTNENDDDKFQKLQKRSFVRELSVVAVIVIIVTILVLLMVKIYINGRRSSFDLMLMSSSTKAKKTDDDTTTGEATRSQHQEYELYPFLVDATAVKLSSSSSLASSVTKPSFPIIKRLENCTLSFVPANNPPRKDNQQEWRDIFWLPSFPGSGASNPSKKGDLIKEFIEGLSVGDDHNNQYGKPVKDYHMCKFSFFLSVYVCPSLCISYIH
ncbi:MAG: hypothetical protein ACI8RD_005245 [Bacillariaceae sp.]